MNDITAAAKASADHAAQLAGFTDDELFALITKAETVKDEWRAAARTGSDDPAVYTTGLQTANSVCATLYREVERRYPEVSDFMDDWADNDDMADPVAYMSYGQALAAALGRGDDA